MENIILGYTKDCMAHDNSAHQARISIESRLTSSIPTNELPLQKRKVTYLVEAPHHQRFGPRRHPLNAVSKHDIGRSLLVVHPLPGCFKSPSHPIALLHSPIRAYRMKKNIIILTTVAVVTIVYEPSLTDCGSHRSTIMLFFPWEMKQALCCCRPSAWEIHWCHSSYYIGNGSTPPMS
ncbi:unnamed protein product [Trypanosoma congolense IL3000]|uniref:WGS project CAEQ00000000 data, annotated contig 1620 n=1 Tax=Trypanosoma congolense (strain IL3000) TaxID=1068625 RepID=F9W7J4_TRYCI|nr:unnamed protein product [Trypanosoma congolense IL3000]